MVKQLYLNGDFTEAQLEFAARVGREARHEAYAAGNGSGLVGMNRADRIGLEAALDALASMQPKRDDGGSHYRFAEGG